VSDLPCAAWDLLPTLMEAAHRSTPDGVDGISFLPTLTGGSQTNRHDFLYWELHDHGFKQAVRMDNWKAVRNGIDGQFELYDLKSDPGEKTDVATDHQEVVGKIAALVKTARTDSPDWPVATAGDK
jgi:arylsulfatase A-like enzyme